MRMPEFAMALWSESESEAAVVERERRRELIVELSAAHGLTEARLRRWRVRWSGKR